MDNVIWLIAGTETCPATHRLHVQGAIIFQSARTMAAVKTTLGDPEVHLERMNGTPQQSLVYCTKEDSDAFTAGVIPAQGARTDIQLLKQSLDSGMQTTLIWESHFPVMLKYHSAVAKYHLIRSSPRDPSIPPMISLWIGPSRTGKSSSCPTPPDAYWHPGGSWWDGYSGEKVVVFDEFYGQLPYHTMLRILDRHPLTVESKGSSQQLQASQFWFTSNTPYKDWWKPAQEKGLDNTSFLCRIEEFGIENRFQEEENKYVETYRAPIHQ